MNLFLDMEELPGPLAQEVIHNASDMQQFYTLTPSERDDVLNRIASRNGRAEWERALRRE